ncbi:MULTISPECIES: YhjD/YihY/BrkB family envelope integrity protein [unclassified Anaeromyxobacter]|uniref:YhjD/YihY/BrkB family envelope integrity protein n=1 Tax=unclassified Anaeromyxobacter TaxID=2620896 RepID=UPI001F57ECB8|nr:MULTISPECIES: YhjD/YihY/BrkB family envelope integrity protein [unclassified Anaeromyxobacter]
MTGPAETRERVVRLLRAGWSAVGTALRVLDSDAVRLRAMALTYITLFALVPALVVAFSVVQAFTGMEKISELVHEFLISNLAVGARDTLEPYLQRFVTNAHATSAGIVGGALLVWSAISLFTNVDAALNDIWGVQRRRPIAQQAVIYWMGITLGPLLLAGSLTLAATGRAFLASSGFRALAVAGGALLTCTFFSLIYLLVPYTKVRIKSAVIAGLAAGVAWELAKWGYALGIGGIVRYHAIYGSVAAIPIFIFWLFVSWTILLFGARLAFVIQYATALIHGAPQPSSPTGKEILAGQAMLQIARAFDRGEPAPDAGDVASRLGSGAEEAGEVLAALRNAGLVVSLTDGGLVPSRPLERLTLLDVRRAIVGRSSDLPHSRGPVAGIVREIEERAEERLAAVDFRALCEQKPSAQALPAAASPSGQAGELPARRA